MIFSSSNSTAILFAIEYWSRKAGLWQIQLIICTQLYLLVWKTESIIVLWIPTLLELLVLNQSKNFLFMIQWFMKLWLPREGDNFISKFNLCICHAWLVFWWVNAKYWSCFICKYVQVSSSRHAWKTLHQSAVVIRNQNIILSLAAWQYLVFLLSLPLS